MAALRGLSLKVVKGISVNFDPFHPQAVTAREFFRILSAESLKPTNPKCAVKSQMLNDGSTPEIEVTFSNKERIVYNIEKKTNCQDILIDFNTRCKSFES